MAGHSPSVTPRGGGGPGCGPPGSEVWDALAAFRGLPGVCLALWPGRSTPQRRRVHNGPQA
jgi:glycine cleavage system protein P-like pyridoxal-binding family